MLLALLAALQSATPERLPATIPNPSFEEELRGWRSDGHRGFRAYAQRQVAWSSDRAADGRGWLEIDWAARSGAPPGSSYEVTTRIDARRYRGRQVAFSAAVRVPDHADRAVRLLARVTGGAASNQTFRPLASSAVWRREQLVFEVPQGASAIEIGFQADGRGGTLEADAARLTLLPRR